MSLRLNKISDEVIRKNIANDRQRVEKFLTGPLSSHLQSAPIRYHRRLSAAAFDVGVELYQQEGDAPEIRHFLALAGKELFALLSLDGDDAALSPLEFEKALALAVCFCPHSVYENAANVAMTKFSPDTTNMQAYFAKPLAFFDLLARDLDVLREFVAAGRRNEAAWNQVEAECLRDDASHYDTQLTLAKLRCLKAVDERNAGVLNEAIAILVEDHENEAKRGEIQQSVLGFVCLPALMFAHLGAARKLVCAIDSPYLPLKLLSQ
jgi:hypothetical protein